MPSKTIRRQRGDGGLYQRADGMWIGVVDLGYGGDGKRRRKTVSARRQADALAKLRLMRRQLDEHGDLPTKSMTVGAWLAHWVENIAAPRLRPNSREQYRSDVRLHITPAVGRYRLDQLAPRHVREMGQAITDKGRSSTTALRCHRVLSKALSDAVREGQATRNVASLVDAPTRAVATRGALTAEQAVTLLRSVATDHDAASRWSAALLTGARQGELLGLEWDRSGLSDGVIDLSWQLQRIAYRHGCVTGAAAPTCGAARAASCPRRHLDVPHGFDCRQINGALHLTRPKTNAGVRLVPLTEPLASVLAAHQRACAAKGREVSAGLVWTRQGRPWDAPADSAAWRSALEAAGLPAVPLHAARHTTATLLLEAGIDAHTVTAILGHSQVTTSRGYQHVSRVLAAEALSRLGERLHLDPAPSAA